MGIDIYARRTLNKGERSDSQMIDTMDAEPEETAHLREAYFSGITSLHSFVGEAFTSPDGAQIPAATLRERLPDVLAVTEWRDSRLLGRSKAEVKSALRDIRKFVKACERIERRSGTPATIQASW